MDPKPAFFSRTINWPNSLFLIGTLLIALIGAPAYVFQFGLSAFQIVLFIGFFIATGLSITVGYHRLFSHRTFQATWPVRLTTLLFGAAAFENSVLVWSADHRRHHKCVDHDNDPYDITKGFFHAHIGWILFRLEPDTPLTWVKDLQQDRLVMWQHNYYRSIGVFMGFVLPALIGWVHSGWIGALGSFLIAGVVRVVFVHHMTFFINSLCHTIGSRPYSKRCTARDSALMAWFTFGEGYHNFHHEFQHDYRNGVKPWQFDPTKWSIWLLNRIGLVSHLRRVPDEKIFLAQLKEQQRQLAEKLAAGHTPIADSIQRLLETAQEKLQQASNQWEIRKADYRRATEKKIEISRERIAELRQDLREATIRFRAALQEWQQARSTVLAQLIEG